MDAHTTGTGVPADKDGKGMNLPVITDLIREIVLKTVRNDVRARILFGTVVSKDPLKIKIEDRLTLNGANLVVPSYLERRTLRLGESEFELVPEVSAGDRLILINLENHYVILGKAGDLKNEHTLA